MSEIMNAATADESGVAMRRVRSVVVPGDVVRERPLLAWEPVRIGPGEVWDAGPGPMVLEWSRGLSAVQSSAIPDAGAKLFLIERAAPTGVRLIADLSDVDPTFTPVDFWVVGNLGTVEVDWVLRELTADESDLRAMVQGAEVNPATGEPVEDAVAVTLVAAWVPVEGVILPVERRTGGIDNGPLPIVLSDDAVPDPGVFVWTPLDVPLREISEL
jgi:hypothetical protein